MEQKAIIIYFNKEKVDERYLAMYAIEEDRTDLPRWTTDLCGFYRVHVTTCTGKDALTDALDLAGKFAEPGDSVCNTHWAEM